MRRAVIQQRQPFAESALKVFMLAGSGEINGYITAKSVTDIYYLIHRITHSDSVMQIPAHLTTHSAKN